MQWVTNPLVHGHSEYKIIIINKLKKIIGIIFFHRSFSYWLKVVMKKRKISPTRSSTPKYSSEGSRKKFVSWKELCIQYKGKDLRRTAGSSFFLFDLDLNIDMSVLLNIKE